MNLDGQWERFRPGAIVRCRGRDWVVLPAPPTEAGTDVLLLRPLAGGEDELAGVALPLVRLGIEPVEPASFPLPTPEEAGDFVSAELLWNAARIALRNGAGPFRALGRLSVRPRPYQYVPLLMALRLDPVRLLIADDVGIGKTIEGALIARELLDRGEIRRLCVLCPPYLCDQWQKELYEKFHIEAEVVRAGTAARLERRLPPDESLFSYYRHLVVSIDYAKSDRHRHAFLLHCPEFVLVDEAHGCARPTGARAGVQQQRHELVSQLAQDPKRHLVLLTATPHSGIEEAFLSLLGLLKPEFERLNLMALRPEERDELAKHFVQRRRPDVVRWLGTETRFPERETAEVAYTLSSEYRDLFGKVWRFARELVRSGETLTGWRQRLRYWTALALLRCVMSSPAAASAALAARAERSLALEDVPEAGWDDALAASYVHDPTHESREGEGFEDVEPTGLLEEGKAELSDSEARKLRAFAREAEALQHGSADTKLTKLVEVVEELLQEGYHPIVWCRYIATSDYVAEGLQKRLGERWPDVRVLSVTGALPEDERRAKVEELGQAPRRVLVATDCLSEGINLQEHFTAVVHYDLPWNPNRLEQREGRVDRFGQRAPKVKAVLLYGRDNPIDGAVLEVLLRKARKIHKSLRIYVPVPRASETVVEAVMQALFFRAGDDPLRTAPQQLALFEDPFIQKFHLEWDRDAERERESRTRFAQRAIKPDEVQRELEETDRVLGDPEAVERFLRAACQRLGVPLRRLERGVYELPTAELPEPVRARLGAVPEAWRISLKLPAPEGATPVGRNHPLVAGLAEYLLERALDGAEAPPAARCAVIRTDAVPRRTTLLLLRLRFLLEEDKGEGEGEKPPLLAEEVRVSAFRGRPPEVEWLPEEEALELLARAEPAANVTPQERRELLEEALGWVPQLQGDVQTLLRERAKRVEEAHRRVRRLTRGGRVRARPQEPPDLLGLYVLLPVPKGVG